MPAFPHLTGRTLADGARVTQQTILIGDDDPAFRRLLTLLFTSAGFRVIAAEDGHAVVRIAQEQRPDLLLVDLVMPQLDGYEALRQLRNDTRTAHIPIIILTARAAPADLVSGFESGADDYVTKPIVGDELLARVRSHLRRAARRPVHSPLTGLPGNVILTEELRYNLRRDDPFALLHLDLSGFKAFNDTYGFARGDKAIHTLAEVLRTITEGLDVAGVFLGHIGGDDFAIIAPFAHAEAICRQAIARFDARIGDLYDPQDFARGYLVALDREGQPRHYPVTCLMIGGAVNRAGRFSEPEQISRCAAEMKQIAKQRSVSNYILSLADGLPELRGPASAV